MATGLPSVLPWRTPAVTVARSFSIFIRPPRPWPSWRRARSESMSSGLSSRPAGRPSTIAVSPGPWDSPAVTKRKDMAPTPYKRGCGRQVGGGTTGRDCLEGNAGRAAARPVGRGTRVERVDRVVDAAHVDGRDPAHGLAAPLGVDATRTVAVEVVLHLVQLGDVVEIVVVLVVLAVEQRVAVHVRVGQVELRERTLGVDARALEVGIAVVLLLPGLDGALLDLPEALPPLGIAGALRGLEPVREPVAVRVALVVLVDAGVALPVIGLREGLRRVRLAVGRGLPRRHRRDVARAAVLRAVAVAQRRLEAHREAAHVEAAARVAPGPVLLERGQAIAVEVIGAEAVARRGTVRGVEPVRERTLARVRHGLDVQVLRRPVLPAVRHLVGVGVGEAGVRPDRQLEAVREQVVVVIRVVVADVDGTAAGAAGHAVAVTRGGDR